VKVNEHLLSLQSEIKKIHFSSTAMEIHSGIPIFKGTYSDAASREKTEMLARELIPWRKGPFQLEDLYIDAEWRSDKKWNRLKKDLPPFQGKLVADVGCNNGYYLFPIAHEGAKKVHGFDPTFKYMLQYELVRSHAPKLPIEFTCEGWEALYRYPQTFDVIFLMGLNYHAPNPLEIFHACKNSLKAGGLFVCEGVVVNTQANLEIFPRGKYAGIGGVYAIPSPTMLSMQLASVGFKKIHQQHLVKMETAEQRSTIFSPQPSLANFLNEDGSSTEGYPPLYRAAYFATKEE